MIPLLRHMSSVTIIHTHNGKIHSKGILSNTGEAARWNVVVRVYAFPARHSTVSLVIR